MKRSGILAAVLGMGMCAGAFGAVESIPFRVEETRSAALGKDNVGHPRDALNVVLVLKGPEAESAIKYGALVLEEAVDDQGTNLIPKEDRPGEAGKFREYANGFFRKFALEQKRAPDAPQVRVDLAPAKRSATRIARLRGSFKLMSQGTLKTVECTGLKTAGTKKLELPAEAGIGISVSLKPGGDGRTLSLEVSGDEEALESIEVVGGDGKKVSGGMSSFSFNGGPVQRSLDLMQPLEDSMKVVAKVAMGRKVTAVKFEVKDVVLP